jgi:hypothetical protein
MFKSNSFASLKANKFYSFADKESLEINKENMDTNIPKETFILNSVKK